MSDIQDALRRIYRLEGDPTDTDPLLLAVTSPVPTSVKKVWPYFPPASQVITSTPCFVNTYSPRTVEYGSALSRLAYGVHARLVVYNAKSDEAAKIASSFLEPIIDRFEAHMKLSGLSEWMLNSLRFETEQPVLFEDLSTASGKTLIGLDFFIDITHNRRSVAAGGTPPSWA